MKRLAVCILFFFSPFVWSAVLYDVGQGAQASFEAIGRPSLLKIRGRGAKIRGQIELVNNKAMGRFELDLNEFDTGIDLRNRHMKEKYLETQKFPTAMVAVTEVLLPVGFAPGQDALEVPFKGTLTLKGVSKPIQGKLDIRGAKMQTNAEFSFSLNDYPIGVPSHLGVSVADVVHIKAELIELVRN